MSRWSASPERPPWSRAAGALIARGVKCVAATRGEKGALVVTADQTVEVPAFAVDVVDTTGCGDAFSAGFLRGMGLGRDLGGAAARLGCAAAALVAQGLGSDHGEFDLATADAFAQNTATLLTIPLYARSRAVARSRTCLRLRAP